MPRDLKRPQRRTRPRIIIVTEGQETEFRYFHGLKEAASTQDILVDIRVDHSRGKDPEKTVQRARSALQDAKDSAWAVFDADNADGSRTSVLKKAIKLAGNGSKPVQIALSNPCFEFWILLHRKDTSRAYTCFQELEPDVLAVFPELKDPRRGGLNKSYPYLYKLLLPHQKTASSAAARLRQQQADTLQSPYTDVDLLVSSVVKVADL